MKQIIWYLINFFRKLFFKPSSEILFLEPNSVHSDKVQEIKRRLNYFLGIDEIKFVKRLRFADYLNFKLLVFFDGNQYSRVLKIKKNEVFNLDFESNYLDGWDYHYLLTKIDSSRYLTGIEFGRESLHRLILTLPSIHIRSYIFGTGPSLANASNKDFSDGIRIVSNTIVKDAETWEHINPHFIVAGDAIYHFGIGKFAQKFRADLKLRLQETNTYFVFPAQFYAFCSNEFHDFKERLIPIPIGSKTSIHHSLLREFSLPIHGNALLLLLLPLGCNFAKEVCLWGFDGRAPDDKLFWSNSSKHFYTDDVDELRILHPKFFAHLVPKSSPELYARMVHGDVLEDALTKAEVDGFTFCMLHNTYTDTLKRRQIIS
jgi:hypothetical protein